MMNVTIPLIAGWLLDRLVGDPPSLPHPIVLFGKVIAFGERYLNKGRYRKLKGALMAATLIVVTFAATYLLVHAAPFEDTVWGLILTAILVFYSLAGTTLVREVKAVFRAVNVSVEQGRQQLARIVGRDTSQLSPQEIRTAALETLAENLSDGVIAPLFWYALFGIPGMLTYKMVNTLDSMIAYRTPRYRQFGAFAAHADDIANYLPARLTAVLMILVDRIVDNQNRQPLSTQFRFLRQNARNHISPNSGYPEAALAAILNCRFGGGHVYFGQYIEKPFIGTNDRQLHDTDMKHSVRICVLTEVVMLVLVLVVNLLVFGLGA